ncbi:MAG: PSD1 domain-containing protein [Acidobacteria bacterium]|nr:PSD1 domain-containing protein [Acidobacteriota bacterium]
MGRDTDGRGKTRRVVVFALLFLAVVSTTRLVAQRAQLSDKDVTPILKQKCFQCHSEALQMSKLDLRTRESMLKGGEKGPAIVPGNAEESRLYRRVAGLEKPQMPMAPLPPLTPQEITVLKEWIDGGANWTAVDNPKPNVVAGGGYGKDYKEKPITEQDRKWWAFQKPVRHPVPKVAEARWSANPIDAFIRQALDQKGLAPAPPADRNTLIRRAYLDLLGLLPSPEEVDAFVNDRSPRAYESLIDRLLASPQYGERWGRFWLDVARYADSSGYEHDRDISNAWKYRDYVIQAFNQDKPYNRFVLEQLAGDELDDRDYDSLTATTYYRIGPRVRFREKDNPYYRYEYLDDMVRTTFQGFMGLSVNCARCHDHKFDPITRADYYRSMAMVFGYVDYDHPLAPADKVAEYERIKKEVEEQVRPLRRQIAQIEAPYRKAAYERRLAKFPEEIQIAVKTPEEDRTPGQKLLAAQIVSLDVDPDAAANVNAAASSYRSLIRVSEADEPVRRTLLDQIQEIQKRLPPPLPVAEGIRDGDYRLTPDGPGDEPLPGKGDRFNYGVDCCFLPEPGRPFAVPPVYFGANGMDVTEDQKSFVVEPGYLKVLLNGTPPPIADPPKSGYISSGRRRALAEWIASPENPLTARVMVNRIWHWHFGRGIVPTPGNFGKMGMPPSHPELLDWLATEFVRQGWSIKQMHRLMMNSETYKMASGFYQAADMEKDPTNVYLWRFPLRRLEGEAIRDIILSASGKINLEAGGEPFFPAIPKSVREGYRQGKWTLTKEEPSNWRRSVYSYWKRGLKYPMFEVLDQPDLNVTCERRNVTTVPTQALTLLNNEFVLIQARHFAERVRREAGNDPAKEIGDLYRIALSRRPTRKELDSYLTFFQKQREYHLARAPEGGADLAALTDVAHVVLNANEFVYIN